MTSAFNKSQIMTKAHSLRKVYGMSKSESLTKAWGMAKLNSLEDQKHSLDLIDHWDSDTRELALSVSAKIQELSTKIYPTKTVELTETYCGMVISTFTREVLDLNAYDAA